MPDIEIRGLRKAFGGTTVLDGVDFTVHDKELVTLLGPSGCGKTTTLMCIAGFQSPDEGRIVCGDDVFVDRSARIDQPAERRNLGMVFQSYAVWPHMTVAQNVAFPLRLRKTGRAATTARVAEVLELVELGALADRYPHQLSGGQQQRVALARAIAYSPGVLLLDEPFSNLDAKLRERARDWLREIQRSIGLTTVFVTHDQDEALAMSDRILVMSGGRIVRGGTPEDVYRVPGVRFAAEFLGHCNFLSGVAETGADGDSILTCPDFPQDGGIVVPGRAPSGTATVAVRPEDVRVLDPGDSAPSADAVVSDGTFLGDHYRYTAHIGTVRLTVHSRQRLESRLVRLHIPPLAATYVD